MEYERIWKIQFQVQLLWFNAYVVSEGIRGTMLIDQRLLNGHYENIFLTLKKQKKEIL